jgi:indoleamine 2,3-dioxygenase
MYLKTMGPAEFGVSPTTGFMPETDPLRRLPRSYDLWEDAAHLLPKLLVGDSIREIVCDLPPFPLDALKSGPEVERAMVLLSYLGHAYVWSGTEAADRIPAVLAVPWHAVAKRLGRPPVLSYASYCLHNWLRIQPDRPVEVGNVALIQNFLAGEDEEWFVLIHADIEMRAAQGVSRLLELQQAVADRDEERVRCILEILANSIEGMNRTMDRMPEHCDPYIYFHRVRPYIHGWRDHPGLLGGVLYEGVSEYGSRPQTFRGETGAQSGIVPALDAVLRIRHGADELRSYLMEMREYMPPRHRAFVEHLEAGPDLRSFVVDGGAVVRNWYNACVAGVDEFRSTHLKFAASYIHQQASKDPKNPSDVGTGGTPFMPYLRKHRDETRASAAGYSAP